MLKILIVEDNPLISEGIQKMIRWKEHDASLVGKAEDGEEALQIIEQFHPDLVITDIRMPGKDGIYLLQKIRTLYPETATIVVSAYDDFSYAKEAVKSGSINYILKPIDPAELNSAVEEAARQKQLREGRGNGSPETEGAAETEEHVMAVLVIKTEHDYSLHDLTGLFSGKRGVHIRETEPDTFIVKFCDHVNTAAVKEAKSKIEGRFLWGFSERENEEEDETHIYQRALQNAFDSLTYISLESDLCRKDLEDEQVMLLSFSGSDESIRSACRKRAADYYSRPGHTLRGLTEIIGHFVLQIYSREDITAADMQELNRMFDTGDSKLRYFSVEDIIAVADRIIQRVCSENAAIADNKKDLILRVKEFVKKNYMQDISLNSIAATFFISAPYLSRTFKQEEGVNLKQFITQMRVERANYLLSNTKDKISDVALQVGYNDPNYFTKVYKKVTGRLPKSTQS
jgi:two-component system response regulator YesN